MSEEEADLLFEDEYRECAALGWCDEPGGCEYKRVHSAWVMLGRPAPIHQFLDVSRNLSILTGKMQNRQPKRL